MSEENLNDALSFVNESAPEAISLTAKGQKRSSGLPKALMTGVAISIHGIILASFFQFMGIIRIPGLEGFTKERMMTTKLSPIAQAPLVPSVAPQVRTKTTPATTSPVRTQGNRQIQPRQTLKTVDLEPKQSGRSSTQPGSVSKLRRDEELPPDGLQEAQLLLESKGFTKTNEGFVADSEVLASNKFQALQSRADQFNSALAKVSEIQTNVARLEQFEIAFDQSNASIAECNFQMNQYPASNRRGVIYHGMNNLDNAAYEELKVTRDQMALRRDSEFKPERDRLRRLQPGRGLPQATEAFKRQREAALTALSEMREVIATTNKKYEAVEGDEDLKRALAKLGQPKLSPSPEFIKNVQLFGQYEKSVGQKQTFEVPKAATSRRAK
jgi:hypothetical protein